ncbi:tetratricopeptide repeat protein [Vibrio parahaemolyticus]|uniref:Tetratricopeptide repeat protein n=1 Tax=Vibrio parahaemolyticus TaxID=670 RepID=A0AAW8PZB0_VIBPH|nr:tetratricopeptide repeat protein [Vibrio parahaemolyticus]EGR2229498.1 sel1 repeat family protein [Vibrio parahaemolyticus]MDS1820896.1 tetratricopeptide repeat protein [Vibrio parahaemolyticus]
MKTNLSLLATILFASYSTAGYASMPPVTFGSLVEQDSQLPAIQLFLAEDKATENNFEESTVHYIKAIELGISGAVWNLMKFVDEGVLNDEHLNKALRKIKSMATEDTELSLFLANYYHNKEGKGKEAFHWMNNSLRLGSTGVSEILADYIIRGIGGADSHYTPIEAATLLKKASDEGSASASLTLAKIFDDGKLIKRNLGQARHYYDIAAKSGMIEANFRLAYFLEHGIGGSKDLAEAAKLYEQLLNTDKASDVHYRLSRLYMYNEDAFENARIDGITHLVAAANLGNHDALYKVGVATYYGSDGFKVNVEKAIEHLKQAAYLGNKLAAQRLVQIYKNGDRNISPNKELMKEFQRILTDAPKV